jgi:hypothetical protein
MPGPGKIPNPKYDLFDVELQNKVIRVNDPNSYNITELPISIKGLDQNYSAIIPIDATGYYKSGDVTISGETVTLELQDANPNPRRFAMLDTSIGRNYIAYYYCGDNCNDKPILNATSSANIAVTTSKLIERNIIYAAID